MAVATNFPGVAQVTIGHGGILKTMEEARRAAADTRSQRGGPKHNTHTHTHTRKEKKPRDHNCRKKEDSVTRG